MGIDYNDDIIIGTLEYEVKNKLGEDAWDELTLNLKIPNIGMPSKYLSSVTRELMQRFDNTVSEEDAKSVLTNVRHGLKHSDFIWARQKFLEFGNIDDFCDAIRKEYIGELTKCKDNNELFYGQPIDDSVLDFVKSQPYMFYGAREDNKIFATAIPFMTQAYLKENNKRKKRYYACHCPFARESILQPEGEVSKTLCYCSLGYTKVFWEAVLDTALDGEVLESVLGGGMLCRFVIYFSDDIMKKYIK